VQLSADDWCFVAMVRCWCMYCRKRFGRNMSCVLAEGAEAAHAGRRERVCSRSCRGGSESEQARRRVLTCPLRRKRMPVSSGSEPPD